MAFNRTKYNERTGKESFAVSATNRSYRLSLQEKYDIYEERIMVLARFFHWDNEKIQQSLSLPIFDDSPRAKILSQKVEERLSKLEKVMHEQEMNSQQSIEEIRKQKPNAVVFQIVNKANIGSTYSIDGGSKLLDGLIFRTSEIEESPFKTRENVKFILNKYKEREEDELKEQKKEERKREKEAIAESSLQQTKMKI